MADRQPAADLCDLVNDQEVDSVLGCARAIWCLVQYIADPNYPHELRKESQPMQALRWLVGVQEDQMAELQRRFEAEG